MNDWILQISSGTGPEEVRHFVAQLAELLAAEASDLGLQVNGVIRYGPECAPRTVQLHLRGPGDRLLRQTGTYLLVARSHNRKRHARKRWFAGVELFPDALLESPRCLEPDDVTISTARSGGPGGQHVNRTASAVRALHRPTNISVRVTSERSQHQNKKHALALIARALAERASQRRQDAARERRHHHYQLQRGHAARAFTLDRRGRLVERPRPPAPRRPGSGEAPPNRR